MSRYSIKVNVSGSWASLCSSPADRLEAVKVACEQLAFALDHGIVFKIIDCQTEQVTAMYNNRPRAGEPHGWHAPRVSVPNPVLAGIDRTTSGAIGQP